MTDAQMSQHLDMAAALTQLRRVTSVLALVSRYQDDVRLQRLLDNLWLDGQRFRARMNPGSATERDEISRGDRWPNEIPALYVSHLTSRPVWPSDATCELLERNVDMFRDEFASIPATTTSTHETIWAD